MTVERIVQEDQGAESNEIDKRAFKEGYQKGDLFCKWFIDEKKGKKEEGFFERTSVEEDDGTLPTPPVM